MVMRWTRFLWFDSLELLGFGSSPSHGGRMSKDRHGHGTPVEGAISIIGPGMTVIGDLETEGTVRIEGTVNGTIRAGKAVVVGKKGRVDGNILTQDAVLAGAVLGTVSAESRLELQADCRIEGDVYARRMQLEEGAQLNGTVQMGERKAALQEDLITPVQKDPTINTLDNVVGRA